MLMKPSDHEKVRAAVETAEQRTSGEIVCVLARRSSDYWEVPLSFAAGVAVLAPAILVLSGFRLPQGMDLLSGWTIAHVSAVDIAVSHALRTYVLAQAALFVAVVAIAWLPGVRFVLAPMGLKHDRVRRRAEEQFAARGLHLTKGRTGVLIFASLAERRAEVIADEAIASKVTPDAWVEVLAPLLAGMKSRDPGSGFAGSIGRAADLLALHFPRAPDDENELPDTVIELDR